MIPSLTRSLSLITNVGNILATRTRSLFSRPYQAFQQLSFTQTRAIPESRIYLLSQRSGPIFSVFQRNVFCSSSQTSLSEVKEVSQTLQDSSSQLSKLERIDINFDRYFEECEKIEIEEYKKKIIKNLEDVRDLITKVNKEISSRFPSFKWIDGELKVAASRLTREFVEVEYVGYSDGLRVDGIFEDIKTHLNPVQTYIKTKLSSDKFEIEKLYEQQQLLHDFGLKKYLVKLQSKLYHEFPSPCVYFLHSYPEDEHKDSEAHLQPFLLRLQDHLRSLGIHTILSLRDSLVGDVDGFMINGIKESNFILAFCTRSLKTKSNRDAGHKVLIEIAEAVGDKKKTIIPIIVEGNIHSSRPHQFASQVAMEWTKEAEGYFNGLKNLVIAVYGIKSHQQEHHSKVWDNLLPRDLNILVESTSSDRNHSEDTNQKKWEYAGIVGGSTLLGGILGGLGVASTKDKKSDLGPPPPKPLFPTYNPNFKIPTKVDKTLSLPSEASALKVISDEWLVIGTSDGTIWRWNIKTGEHDKLGKHDGPIVGFGSFNQTIVSASENGETMGWDVDTKKRKFYRDWECKITCLGDTGDDSIILGFDYGFGKLAYIKRWINGISPLIDIDHNYLETPELAVLADGNIVANIDNRIWFYDRTKKFPISLGKQENAALAALRNGFFASSGTKGQILIWDAKQNATIKELKSKEAKEAFNKIILLPNNFLAASAGNVVEIFDPDSGETVQTLKDNSGDGWIWSSSINALAVGKNFIVTGSTDKTVKIWVKK